MFSGEKTMWLNRTSAKVEPANVDKAVAVLSSAGAVAAFRNAPGFRSLVVLQSVAIPDEIQALSFWDSEEHCNAFYASPEYRQAFGTIKEFLVGIPGRDFFTVHLVEGALVEQIR
jgi:heme-degrading monooxygenase HmoA